MTPSLARHAVVGLGAVMLVAAMPSPSDAQAASEALLGKTISAQVRYDGRARRSGREFDNPVRFEYLINVGRDNRVSGTVTRHVIGPRGPQSETRSFSASIGKAEKIGEGHRLMVLNGNTLTMLRTFEVGGAKTTITVRGNACTIRSPMMKEAGAGPNKRQSVVGGAIEILSARQVGTSCQIR